MNLFKIKPQADSKCQTDIHFILNYHPETDKVLVFEPKTVAVSEKNNEWN